MSDAQPAPLISVVICTYNRRDWLDTALESASRQSLPADRYEVLVVDNNSSDDTRGLVQDWAQRCPNIRYCHEPKVGLSNARNRGWREARGTWVAYTDDDCKLPEVWLTVAAAVIADQAPGMFGGPYYPFYNTVKPAWFKDAYASDYRGDVAKAIDDRYLPGCNLFIRRDLLALTRGFDPSLGVQGTKRGWSEESEMFRQIRRLRPGERTWYDPRLFVYHLARPEQLTVAWQLRRRFSQARYFQRINPEVPPQLGRREALRRMRKTLASLVTDLGYLPRRDRNLYPHWHQYACEVLGGHLWRLGRLYQRLFQGPLPAAEPDRRPSGEAP